MPNRQVVAFIQIVVSFLLLQIIRNLGESDNSESICGKSVA